MADTIRNRSAKGRGFMWFIVYFILFIILIIYVSSRNMDMLDVGI